ncbi:MAG: ribosome assembly factor SBDS [Candidatus Bathyarchaeota archaeon]
MEKYTTARLSVEGDHFEILVKPDIALDFKSGKQISLSKILVANEIFSDANKGLRISDEKLKKAFNTTNILEIAEAILRRGELQLTTEQRRRLVEEKRKQIISFISRKCVDPRTGYPHPPLRVEQAIRQIRIVVDPFKSGEEQARAVIDALRPILPLKFGSINLSVKIPPEHAAKVIGIVKEYGTTKSSEWQSDGSWIAIVELPTGLHTTFLERIGKATHGNYQTKIL